MKRRASTILGRSGEEPQCGPERGRVHVPPPGRHPRGAGAVLIKIMRTGHGFCNFDNYRLRVLLHCGVD
jgi:hypothetical protein